MGLLSFPTGAEAVKLLLKMLGPSFFQLPPGGWGPPRLAVGVTDDRLHRTLVQGLSASCGDLSGGDC